MTLDAAGIRKVSLATLSRHGFKTSPSLPLSEGAAKLRPLEEIAGRLAALNLLFVYVAAPADEFPTDKLQAGARVNRLRDHLTLEEARVLDADRGAAQEQHGNAIGWRTENSLALSWVLGATPALPTDGSMLTFETIQPLVTTPSPTDPGAYNLWIKTLRPRSVEEVAAMEDLFYCLHNAVRSAQVELMQAKGRPPARFQTVPESFDPIGNGGVVHERRHALTWALSPGVAWDKTDLST